MKRYMAYIIRGAEYRVDRFLATQVKNAGRKEFGGMKSEIFEVKPTIYVMADAVSCYLNKGSRYFQSDRLYASMKDALLFIRNCQREDGSFDYPSCNFKSAPDTSFCFKRLIAAYRLLEKYSDKDRDQVLKEQYREILIATFPILIHGGFHTPNHRWGITAALLQGANMVKGTAVAAQLLERAHQYLSEGIDGNEEGEYAERSTGNYNAVVNNAMLAMYEETGDSVYIGYVERNLKMMMYYFDPDDTIFTQNSTRQDQGKSDYPSKYFYQYLFMAAYSGEKIFDKAAHKIIKDCMERGDMAPECLHIIMLHDGNAISDLNQGEYKKTAVDMLHYEFHGYGFMDTYKKYFMEAGVLRVKTPNFGYSLLTGKSAFAFLKFGETSIYLKIGESYCDIRNFIPTKLENDEKEYELSATAKGWYYLPFKQEQNTKDWWKMDHSKRDKLISSEIDLKVIVKEVEKGLEFTVNTKGLDRVPLRVEICIPAGSILDNPHFYTIASKGEGMILRDDYVILRHGLENIKIGPGFGTHEFGGHYSGEEKNETGYTIYLNDYTPYTRTFQITME